MKCVRDSDHGEPKATRINESCWREWGVSRTVVLWRSKAPSQELRGGTVGAHGRPCDIARPCPRQGNAQMARLHWILRALPSEWRYSLRNDETLLDSIALYGRSRMTRCNLACWVVFASFKMTLGHAATRLYWIGLKPPWRDRSAFMKLDWILRALPSEWREKRDFCTSPTLVFYYMAPHWGACRATRL